MTMSILILAAFAFGLIPSVTSADYTSDIGDDKILLEMREASARTVKDDSHRGKSTSTHRNYVSMPEKSCFSPNLGTAAVGACMHNFVCPDRTAVSPELLAAVREQYSIGPRDAAFCNDGPAQPRRSGSLRNVVTEEWRQIQLPAPVIEVQPADHRTLVNLDTYTQAPQETFRHTTTLLGQQVDIRANATMWHWDLGDGSPVISEDHPGTAFPDPTGYFHYRQPGNYTITLTIEWEAEFSADQEPTWQPIPGTGQPTASLDIEAGEHRPRLQYTP